MSLIEKICSHVPPPEFLSFFTASISSVLFFFIVPPNLFICWVVYKEPRKHLQTSFNCLVVNLALADLAVGLVALTIATYVHILEGIVRHPSLPILPVGHVSYFICCTASSLGLTAMSVDRYTAVVYPIVYRNKFKPRKTVVVSILIWVFSIVLPSTLYFQVGFVIYTFVFANTTIIISVAILVFSYITIYRTLRTQVEVSNRLQMGINSQRAQRRAFEREKRNTRTFLLIFAAYFVCYTPSCVLIYILNFCGSCSCVTIHWIRDMQFVFVWLNSSFNPFLYSWQIQSFRSAILARLPCQRRRLSGNISINARAPRGNLADLNENNPTFRLEASEKELPQIYPMVEDTRL